MPKTPETPETRIEQLLQETAPPAFTGKDAVWHNIESGAWLSRKRLARRTALRAGLALVVLLALVTTTVFAEEIAEAVRLLMYGEVTVNEYREEWLAEEPDDDPRITARARIHFEGEGLERATSEEIAGGVTDVEFASPGEMAAVLNFTPLAPATDAYVFESGQVMQYNTSGRYSQSSTTVYHRADFYMMRFWLVQTYAGEGAGLDVYTTQGAEEMQKVEIKGIEAVYIERSNLYWADGEYTYMLTGGYEFEDTLAFAESLYE